MILRKLAMVLMVGLFVLLTGCQETIMPEVEISGVSEIKVGSIMSLTTNYEVSKVNWSTSNPQVASVTEEGLVNGLASGDAEIRAELISNSNNFSVFKIRVIADEEEPIFDTVKLGIDRIDEYSELFLGKRVGLITNPTGLNSNYQATIDVLNAKVNLTALFAPEHGIRGNLQAGEYLGTYVDEKTDITVYSLYGATLRPTEEMMDQIDILCIDLQDAGSRFYTYVYTMAYAMEACAEYGKKFVVFDRPNPINGVDYEGNILDLQFRSFIGYYPIVQRHGMTIGELAKMFNEEFSIGCDLEVILMEGWKRTMYYDDTKLPWVIPSPNFPSIDTAIVYPGTCIIEGTNLSEGRGTTIPFQVIGAPFVNANQLADALNAISLPGVNFRPAYFTPMFSKHSGVLCNGIQVHVTDRETFKPVKTGWAILEVLRSLYPDDVKLNSSLNKLAGNDYLSKQTYDLPELFAIIAEDTAEFGQTRAKYLLYSE